MKNYLHILGSGSAQTTPCHGCKCKSCNEARTNKKYVRDCSVYLFNFDDVYLLIDYGSSLLNKYGLSLLNIDYIFISHSHADHFKGLFPLIWTQQNQIPVYYSGEDLSGAFKDLLESPKHVKFIKTPVFKPIELKDSIIITPILLTHNVYTTGYYIKFKNYSIAYLLDTKGLPEITLKFLNSKDSIDLVLIDSNYGPNQESNCHNNMDDALQIIDTLQPKKAILTHISHKNFPTEILLEYLDNNKPIKDAFLAFDDMKIEF
ncbi:MAG: MBL fold metallo-hydrolase [Candidatus Helarchaeota archaeon]